MRQTRRKGLSPVLQDTPMEGGVGEVQEGGAYVYLWPIHVDVWQKPTQYYKAFILPLKIKKKDTRWQPLQLPHFSRKPKLGIAGTMRPRDYGCEKQPWFRGQETLDSSHFLKFTDHMSLHKLCNYVSSFFICSKYVM